MVWTQAARRAVARAVIPKLFAEGYSASAALRVFSTIGPGLRRKLWLADWREITGAKKLERVYRFIPKKLRLSYALMAPTETFQRREFKYVFDTEVLDTKTGKSETRTQSMESDRRLSPEEAMILWSAEVEDEEAKYDFGEDVLFRDTTLRVVYRRKPIRAILPEPTWIEKKSLGPEWV